MVISELAKFTEQCGTVTDADAGLEFARKQLEQFTLTPDANQSEGESLGSDP